MPKRRLIELYNYYQIRWRNYESFNTKSKKASVTIDNKLYSEIESGILALVGIEKGDSTEQVEKLAKK